MNLALSRSAFLSLAVGAGLLMALDGVGCASQKGSEQMAATRLASGHVTVPVELDDYVIRMPAKIPAGDITFDVKNVGEHPHNIRVRGPGHVDARLPDDLSAGQSRTLDVHLGPGTYRITCPVGPHAMMGMTRTLTVEP